jgi:hypothetical protein
MPIDLGRWHLAPGQTVPTAGSPIHEGDQRDCANPRCQASFRQIHGISARDTEGVRITCRNIGGGAEHVLTIETPSLTTKQTHQGPAFKCLMNTRCQDHLVVGPPQVTTAELAALIHGARSETYEQLTDLRSGLNSMHAELLAAVRNSNSAVLESTGSYVAIEAGPWKSLTEIPSEITRVFSARGDAVARQTGSDRIWIWPGASANDPTFVEDADGPFRLIGVNYEKLGAE